MTADPVPAGATRLWIVGDPVPQGSKKPQPIYRGSKAKGTRQWTGKVRIAEELEKTLKPWRDAVTLQARHQYRGLAPLDGDLSVAMVFALRRPRTVTRPYPNVPPDLSKLVRAVEDSLKVANVIADDGRFIRYHEPMAKIYAGGPYPDDCPELTKPGVWVEIVHVGEPPALRRVAPRQGRPDPADLETLRLGHQEDDTARTGPFECPDAA